MNEIERLLEEYNRQFGEAMPLSMVHMTEKELLDTLRRCLETNEKFELPDEVRRLMNLGVDF